MASRAQCEKDMDSFMTIRKMNFTKKLLKSGKTVLDGPMKPMNNTGLTVKRKIYKSLIKRFSFCVLIVVFRFVKHRGRWCNVVPNYINLLKFLELPFY